MNPRYQLLEVLGKGSYGTVCSAIDTKSSVQASQTPATIAIKKVTKIFKRQVLMKRAIRELKFMNHFNGHKNIISLIDLDLVHTEPFEGLYCYQEMCDFDLARVIYSSTQFSEFHIQNFAYQILCGVKYIHSADVIHRDLKPGNILVTVQGNLKICDFGLARGISKPKEQYQASPITNYVATRWYRAPELILGTRNYDKSIDIWAVGCILAELYGRKPLFIGKDQLHQLTEILKVVGSPPRTLMNQKNWNISALHKTYLPVPFRSLYPFASSLSLDLLENLLVWDQDQRFTVSEALNHPFFESIRNPAEEISCDVFEYGFEYTHNSLSELHKYLQSEVKSFKSSRGSRG